MVTASKKQTSNHYKYFITDLTKKIQENEVLQTKLRRFFREKKNESKEKILENDLNNQANQSI